MNSVRCHQHVRKKYGCVHLGTAGNNRRTHVATLNHIAPIFYAIDPSVTFSFNTSEIVATFTLTEGNNTLSIVLQMNEIQIARDISKVILVLLDPREMLMDLELLNHRVSSIW